MYKLLLSTLLLPSLTFAQPTTVEKPIICDTPKAVFEALSSEPAKEQPFWAGLDATSRYVLLVNSETNTWSFVQFNNRVACVLAIGSKSQQLFSKPPL